MKSAAGVETLEIAKHDGRGRRLAAAEEREALIAAYETSGMTQRAFSEKEGINPFTLASWLRKRRLDAAKPNLPGPQRFVELATPRVAGFSLEVVMADGLIVRGSDSRQVVALIRGLR